MRIHCDRNNQATNKTKWPLIIRQLIKRQDRLNNRTEPCHPRTLAHYAFRARQPGVMPEQSSRSAGQSSGADAGCSAEWHQQKRGKHQIEEG